MTEKEFREWLQESNQSIMKQQKIMLFCQLILTVSLILYVIRWLPAFLLMACLLAAIAFYKKTFDELAYINLSLHSFEGNLPVEKESWYYKDPRYPSGVTLLKTNLATIIKYNSQLGYRILVYMVLAIVWYVIN